MKTDGAKKVLWFTAIQLQVLNELVALTGDSNSKIVRDGMKMYLDTIKRQK